MQRPVAQTMHYSSSTAVPSTPPSSSTHLSGRTAVKMMLPSDILASTIRPVVEGQGIQLIQCGANCLLGLDKAGKIVPILLKQDEILIGQSDQDLPSAAQLDDVLESFMQKWQLQHPMVTLQVSDGGEQKELDSPDTPSLAPTSHQTLDAPVFVPVTLELPPKQTSSSSSSPSTSSVLKTAGTSIALLPKPKHKLPRTMHVYPHPSAPRLISVGFPMAPKEYGSLMVSADDSLENPFLIMKPSTRFGGRMVAHPDQAGIGSVAGTFATRYAWHPEFECVIRTGQKIKKTSSSSATPSRHAASKAYQPTVTKFAKGATPQTSVAAAVAQTKQQAILFQPKDSYRIWIGLCDQDIWLVDQPSCHRFVGFRYSSALDSSKGTWQCVTSDGTYQPFKDSTGLTITDSKVKFEEKQSLLFSAQVTLKGVDFFINGDQVALHSTSLPDASTPFGIVCMLMNTGQDGLDEISLSKFSLNY